MRVQNTTDRAKAVRHAVASIIYRLAGQQDSGAGKAMLAHLRRTAGQSFAEAQAVWPLLLSQMPEVLLSDTGVPTAAENAVFVALQLYALCQQGSRRVAGLPAKDQSAAQSGKISQPNIGASFRDLRSAANEKALDRRFNAMLTTESFDELAYHLRQLIKLARAAGIRVIDFPLLAEDLFWIQQGGARQVKLRWATAYYRTNWDHQETKEEEAPHAE